MVRFKNIFTRILDTGRRRRGRRCGAGLRRRCGNLSTELLEQRRALSVNTVYEVSGGSDPWTTVVTDYGSDVYLSHSGDARASLLVANNSSFRGTAAIESGLDFDQVYAIANFNSQYEQLAVFEGEPVPVNEATLRDVAYPSYGSGNDLVFTLPSKDLDSIGEVFGRLVVGDVAWDFETNSTNPKQVAFSRTTPAGEAVAETLLYEDFYWRTNQQDENNAGIVFRGAASVLGISPADNVRLDITYDPDITWPLQSADPDRDDIRIRAVGLLPAGFGSKDITVVELEAGQTIVPGTVRGVGRLSMLGDTVDVGFTVSPLGEVSLWLSGADTNAGSLAGRQTKVRQTKRIHDNNGTYETYTKAITASFNSTNGVLSVQEVGVGAGEVLPGDNATPPGREASGSGLFGFEVVRVEAAIYDESRALATEVTLYNGLTHRAGLTVGLPSPNSIIRIDSPISVSADGAAPASVNDVRLAATTIEVNSGIETWQDFVVPQYTPQVFGTKSEVFYVNAALNAANFDIYLADSQATLTPARSQLRVGRSGELDSGNRVFIDVEVGDILVDGIIDATDHTYIMKSGADDDSRFAAPFRFETGTYATGLGQIRGDTVLVQLGNDIFGEFFETTAFSVVSLDTDIDTMRVRSASRRGDETHVPFPYELEVRESDSLIIDTVSASSREISVFTNGDLTVTGTMRSGGDIRLESNGVLDALTPIETSFGKIALEAGNVVLRSGVRVLDTIPDERVTDIYVRATGATLNASRPSLSVENVVGAINRVEFVADSGSIGGTGLVIADRLKATAAENVVLHTEVHNADVLIRPASATLPGGSGIVALHENDYLSATIKNAEVAILVANGHDEYLEVPSNGGPQELLSPALFGDLKDTRNIFLSTPNGSMDVELSGAEEITLGNLSTTDVNTVKALNPIFELETMRAGGSVKINSVDAKNVRLFDGPQALSGAAVVRFMARNTIASIQEEDYWNTETSQVGWRRKQIDVEWSHGAPGFDYSHIEFSLPVRDVMELFGFDAGSTQGDPPTNEALVEWNEQFRPSDTILLKEGISDKNGNVNRAVNGLYQVASKEYVPSRVDPNTSIMTVRLVRMQSRDQSPELSQAHYVTVDAGLNGQATHFLNKDGIEFVAPDHSGDDPLYTKIAVNEVDSRPGFTAVKAVTTTALPGSYAKPDFDHVTGAGGFGKITSRLQQSIEAVSELFGGVSLKKDDLVLVRFGTDQDIVNSVLPRSIANGVYRVADVGREQNSFGLNGKPWVLTRYEGADEIGAGSVSNAFTGLAAIEQGWLRTRATGKMFEYYYDAVNTGDIKYEEIKSMQEFAANNEVPDRSDYYETVIDTALLGGQIELVVSQSSGGNTDAGTMGRMLDVLQQNATERSMVLSFDRDLIQADSGENAPVVTLTEQLPAIVRPVFINGSGVIIDGSGIENTVTGEELRIQEGGRYFGPVRPSEVFVARRRTLTRAAGYGDTARLSGLSFGTNTSGSVIKDITVGGFENGAAIEIVGASNILLEDVQVGGDREVFELLRKRLGNRFGITVTAFGERGDFVTLQNVSAFDSSEAGVDLARGTQNVRILGTTIGAEDFGNAVGVRVGFSEDSTSGADAGGSLPHSLGVYVKPDAAQIIATSAVFVSGVETVKDIGGSVTVAVPGALLADGLEVGLQAYDRVNRLIWEVTGVTASGQDLVEVGLRLKHNETESEFVKSELWPARLEFGALVEVERDSDEVMLQVSQVDPRNLYLGQELSFIEDNWFFGTPVIRKITTPGLDETLEAGVYRLKLSETAQRSGFAFLNLVGPGTRNTITFNKNIGVQLSGASVQIVGTDVSETEGTGISVEGFDAWGTAVDDYTKTLPVIQIGGIGFSGSRSWDGPNNENVSVFSNRGAGITLNQKVFEEVGEQIVSGFVAKSFVTTGVEEADRQQIEETKQLLRERFQEYVLIAGNFIGTDLLKTSNLANGSRFVKNIEPVGLTGNAEVFRAILFEGVADDGSARFDHDGDGSEPEATEPPIPTPITSNDFQSLPRYRAPLRPEVFRAEEFKAIYPELGVLDPGSPLDAAKISELEALRGLDSMGNFYGFVPKYTEGDPDDTDTIGGTPVDPPTDPTTPDTDPDTENPGPSEPRPEPDLWPGVEF
jgi:hypothetical protein